MRTPPPQEGWYVFTADGTDLAGPFTGDEAELDAREAKAQFPMDRQTELWVGEVMEGGTVDESYNYVTEGNIFTLPSETAQAMRVLTSWDGKEGWIVDVTISVSAGSSHTAAKHAVLDALETLGIKAREYIR